MLYKACSPAIGFASGNCRVEDVVAPKGTR